MTTSRASYSLAIAALVAALAAAGLAGCNSRQLIPLDTAENVVSSYATVQANFCTSPPTVAPETLKYLFILDHSASNQPGFPLTPGDVTSTDPTGSRRYGPLVNFVSNLTPNPNAQTGFALIDFNDTATQVGKVQGFDPSAASFVATVTTDWIGQGTAANPQPADLGFTNYEAALALAEQLIKEDAAQQAANPTQTTAMTSYIVIFVSDGVPLIATGTPASPTYLQTFAADIGPALNGIMGLKSQVPYNSLIANITIDTAYYDNGTIIPAAQMLLQQMSLAGNGQYLQFDSGANILYQQFAPPSQALELNLADVFVDNLNAVWWGNGSFMPDSDGDGIPDAIEAQLGSNPSLRDSDGNGVSDLVEYRTKGKPCNDPNCAAAGRDQYAICAGFSPVTDASGNVTFSSTSNDGLNDCEKFLMSANPATYNTNGDLVPDFFAFRFGLPIQPGTSAEAFADPFRDGIENYQKLKLGLPLQVSAASLSNGFLQRSLSLTQTSSSPTGVSCYSLTASHVALASPTDTIRVMMVQNAAVAQDKPFMLFAEAPVSGGAVQFSPSDFKSK